VATPSEHNPYRKELDDMLHDLNILENIEQLTGQLRLRYEVCYIITVQFTPALQHGRRRIVTHCYHRLRNILMFFLFFLKNDFYFINTFYF